jgi:hypothetical protein
MKIAIVSLSNCLLRLGFFTILCMLASPAARAGLTVDMHLYNNNNSYFAFPLLSTNTVTSNNPSNTYFVSSPLGGIHGELDAGSTFSQAGSSTYGDLGSLIQELTNGNWTLLITNTLSTNQYSFKVSVTGVTSNQFAPVVITFPTNGAVSITNTPTFAWQGPTNWQGTLNVNENFTDTNGNNYGEASASLPPGQTNWPCPVVIPNGNNNFSADYQSNVTAMIVANTPTNNLVQPLSGWVSTATLETYNNSQFIVGLPVLNTSSGGHTLVAHYTFDDANNLGVDSSGNGYDFNDGGNQNGGSGVQATNDAEAGGGAIDFFRNDSDPYSAGYQGWYPSTPSGILSALQGSFSVSVWVKTTASIGNPGDLAYYGSAVIAADVNGLANDTIPIALTGGQVAFNTGGDEDDTLNSSGTVIDGFYHHIVVTRDQATGNKTIYIDGGLDSTGSGTTNLLNDPQSVVIGAIDDAGNPTLGGSIFYGGFDGEMDDLQIYSGVLSPTEVANLFNNPGTTAPNVSAGGLVVHYTFDDSSNLGADTSGNGYDLDYNSGNGVSSSSDAEAGGGAAYFDGGSFFSYTSTPSAVLNALAGNFTLSFWIKTAQNDGNEGGPAWAGAGIVAADIPFQYNDIVPAALDGGEIGFNTGGASDDTVNSQTDINDGNYHHVVITRNQTTGEKQIYIDGTLDNSDFATTNLLNDPMLVAVGCAIDASQSNPDNAFPHQYFQGSLDDLQLYSRVVTSDEVTFLYDNPGATLGSSPYTPYPVDVSLQLDIVRSQDPNLGEIFLAYPSFVSVSPQATTINSVQSPNGQLSSSQYPGGGESSSTIYNSLDPLLDECTNGLWKIYINQDSPTQQVYSFQVSISGLNTNLLKAVKVFSPTNGALNVATNPVYYWTGPSNYTTLVVDLLSGPVASLPVTATNWASAPTLSIGTNRFDVNYTSNNFPGVTFTTPVDASSNPVRTWTTTVNLSSEAFDIFAVGATPTQLINAQRTGTNFQFSFLSQTGVTNSVQYRTNLVLGNWLTYSNVTGDGTLKTIPIPLSVFGPSPQGFIRVSTQ